MGEHLVGATQGRVFRYSTNSIIHDRKKMMSDFIQVSAGRKKIWLKESQDYSATGRKSCKIHM